MVKDRVKQLRGWMKDNGYDAVVIPTNDPHFSEYVADHWKCREFISGFTGSAGIVVITAKEALLWCDSRYFIQSEQELDFDLYTVQKIGLPETPTINEWLKANLRKGTKVAIDGKLFSVKSYEAMQSQIDSLNIVMIEDPFTVLWPSRPFQPKSIVRTLDDTATGESICSKQNRVCEALQLKTNELYVISALDEIAWMLNVRGSDVRYNPVVVSYLVIGNGLMHYFVNPEKLLQNDRDILENKGVEIFTYDQFDEYLKSLKEIDKIIYNPQKLDIYHYNILKSIGIVLQEESDTFGVINSLKAVKNGVELYGVRKAMVSDGVALVKFFMWLEQALDKGEYITEMTISDKLHESRLECPTFVGDSFCAIVGYRENGAIVHYSPSETASKEIHAEGFLLIDSGGQYEFGTTDITRTVHLSTPTDKEKNDFTLVLKGNISLVMAVFPVGTCGYYLDILARQHLLKQGLNYMHGTGHGIGHYLNVHEGPHSIRMDYNPTTLKPGMLVSNEPGLYRKGEYGIRIENILECKEHSKSEFGTFLKFETQTLFPMDIKSINVGMLSVDERHWLNRYHSKVYDKLAQYLDTNERLWLANKTKAI